jgi:hypothetical protein
MHEDGNHTHMCQKVIGIVELDEIRKEMRVTVPA